jgi:hypothetical protein
MSLSMLREESGGETLRSAFLRGRDGRSDGFVVFELSAKEGASFVRFRVDVDIVKCECEALPRIFAVIVDFCSCF